MTDQPAARTWLPRWSVRSRILASILVVAALGLAGAGAVTYLVQRSHTLGDIDTRLLSRVAAARSVSTAPGGYADTAAAMYAVIQGVVPGSNESSMGLVDGKPRYLPSVASPLHLDRDPVFVSSAVKEVSSGHTWLGSATTNDGHIRYVAVPLSVPGSGSGVYIAAISIDAELAGLTASFATYSLVALIALVAIGVVGWFVAGRLLGPIRGLRAAASRITASERNERIPVVGHDDVSDLTETVNDMLDRLDAALTSQRQLLDDVRHELKTPITIVRGHLELLDAGNATEVEAARAIAIDELDRMSGLVDDIQALAEADRAGLVRAPFDIADLTASVFAKVSALPGHEWRLVETAHVSANLDGARITQAWLQLADNAAKYSEQGTPVELGSRMLPEAVEFWVADRGPGIPRESWQRVFERFGRVDTGRGIRGSGLGLAIVKNIAEAHGGRVSLESDGGGSRLGIVVPLGQGFPVEQGEESP
jgi:two-component system OmpR family sensor kinase